MDFYTTLFKIKKLDNIKRLLQSRNIQVPPEILIYRKKLERSFKEKLKILYSVLSKIMV